MTSTIYYSLYVLFVVQGAYYIVGSHNSTRDDEGRKRWNFSRDINARHVPQSGGGREPTAVWPRIWVTTTYYRRDGEPDKDVEENKTDGKKWTNIFARLQTIRLLVPAWCIQGISCGVPYHIRCFQVLHQRYLVTTWPPLNLLIVSKDEYLVQYHELQMSRGKCAQMLRVYSIL